MTDGKEWYIFILLVMSEICRSPLTLIGSYVFKSIVRNSGYLSKSGRLTFQQFFLNILYLHFSILPGCYDIDKWDH